MVAATTLDTLRTTFRTAIEGMTPRILQARATTPWRFYEKERPPGTDARWFRLEIHPGEYQRDGFMGPNMVDTRAYLMIITDYGGLPFEQMLHVAEDDHFQLRDVLNALKDPITPGLVWVESEGPPSQILEGGGGRDQARIEHEFLIRYWKARA